MTSSKESSINPPVSQLTQCSDNSATPSNLSTESVQSLKNIVERINSNPSILELARRISNDLNNFGGMISELQDRYEAMDPRTYRKREFTPSMERELSNDTRTSDQNTAKPVRASTSISSKHAEV